MAPASSTVEQLRDHMAGWLCRFAEALGDVEVADRLDPDAHQAGSKAAQTVLEVRDRIEITIAADTLTRRHLIAAVTMDGPAVVAMMAGEYIVHGWHLAQEIGQPWTRCWGLLDERRVTESTLAR